MPSDRDIKARIETLLQGMSLEEKVGQLNQLGVADFIPGPNPEEIIRRGGAGSILWLNDTKKFNALQKIAVEESPSKIPLLFALDVIHGYHTIFPVPLAMASSWDTDIVERAQAVAAKEARAAGIHWTFGPMIDVTRDARWGRIVEGAGEDTFLNTAMAVAQIRGFQGDYVGSPDHVIACAKHFAGYGASDGGRDYDPVYLSENQLRNIYLPPFEAAVKAGVGTFMSAYMDLNDLPASANTWLLKDILRGEWGFQGVVVSDAFAVLSLLTQGLAKDERDAAFRAFNAGLDVDMASGTYLNHLAKLFEDGTLKTDDLDHAVRAILTLKLQMGLFENPYSDERQLAEVIAQPEHRETARTAAQRSIVLLRNEDQLLPLSKNLNHIAVIGPVADSQEATEGSWMVFGHVPNAVTVLEGVRAKLPHATVDYASGPSLRRDIPSMFDRMNPNFKDEIQTAEASDAAFQFAVETAQNAELVILVLGENANMAGEAASRASLDLPGRQEELLKAIVALGKPVVLVLLNGRPLSINWAAENVPAILEAWEPGSEGGHAVANILFGDVNPGGKLPVSFPRSASHAPLYYARNLTHSPEGHPMYNPRYWDGIPTTLYPFGYGLSYTTFSINNLNISASQITVGETVHVTADVTNTGTLAGDEVVQLYIHQRYGSDSRPMRELKGFERVSLQPNETKTVSFILGPDQLQYWSTDQGQWVQESTRFDIWVGADSQATLQAELTVID